MIRNVTARRALYVSVAAVSLVLPGVASSQTTDTASTDVAQAEPDAATPTEGAQLDEIVVTGQKRAAGVNLQRSSVAATVVGAEQIEANFIQNIRDVARIAPNVQLTTSGSFASMASFFIRGIGLNSTVRTVDPAVALFVDGTYIGFGPMSLPDTFDVASIEVLRGPQGTLFGKNVVGGAVVMEHQKPTQKLEGKGQVSLGSYDRRQFAGAINVPIGDAVAVRLTAVKTNRDGYWRNFLTGNTIGGIDTFEFRPQIRFRPVPALDITLTGEYVRDTGGSVATEGMNSFIDPRRVGASFTPTPTLAQSIFGYIPPTDKYTVGIDEEGYVDGKVRSIRLNGTLDVGHGIVTLLTGYRKVNFNSTTDFDGTPFTLLTFKDNMEQHSQKSGELRYASTFSDILEFTVGLYYYDARLNVLERRDVYAGGGPAAPLTSRTAYLSRGHDTSKAAFFQGRYEIVEGLNLVAGGRYSDELKRISVCPFNATTYANPDAVCPVALLPGRLRSTGFTPKFGVDWQVSSDVFTYASVTKGLRSGSFNARATNLPSLGPALDETVWSYEAGVKSEFFDRRLRANVAVYLADYSDIQRSIATTIFLNGVPANSVFLTNAASGRIWGTELDFNAIPTPGLNLFGSVGYTNAKYNEITGVDADRNGSYVPAVDDPLAVGLDFERVPRWSYNIGGSYEVDAGDIGRLTFRTNYSWRSSQFVDTISSPAVQIPAYGLWDASVSLATYDDRYRISLYGSNLGDVEYHDLGFDGGPYRTRTGGAPRTFGVELAARF